MDGKDLAWAFLLCVVTQAAKILCKWWQMAAFTAVKSRRWRGMTWHLGSRVVGKQSFVVWALAWVCCPRTSACSLLMSKALVFVISMHVAMTSATSSNHYLQQSTSLCSWRCSRRWNVVGTRWGLPAMASKPTISRNGRGWCAVQLSMPVRVRGVARRR